jgi:hypothetical protein
VLYFYPNDDTPGCTAEACSFRDEHDAIAEQGAVVLGVSTNDAASHRRFREKHGLPFPLLVDEGAKVATRYGAWGEKTLYGRTSIGMIRPCRGPRRSLPTTPFASIFGRACSMRARRAALRFSKRFQDWRGICCTAQSPRR